MKHTIHAFVRIKMWYFFFSLHKDGNWETLPAKYFLQTMKHTIFFCILIKHLIWKNTYKYICHYENKILLFFFTCT